MLHLHPLNKAKERNRFEPCYLRFLRVGNPPKYIFSCPFKLSPKWLPVEVVAMVSSSLVSMSTIDMLAGRDLRLVSKYQT